MFNYYEETGNWIQGNDLDEAYEEFLKKENEYIDSMVKELNQSRLSQTNNKTLP
jgi:hypothetical protein